MPTDCLTPLGVFALRIDLAAILTDVFPALVYEKAHSAEAQHDELVIKRIERAKGWNVEQSATK
jgi:hypothetical protein